MSKLRVRRRYENHDRLWELRLSIKLLGMWHNIHFGQTLKVAP